MAKFSMLCSCGDKMEMEAGSREEAVSKMKAMMTGEAIKAHMEQNHPGKPLMSVAECHAEIEKNLQPA